MATTYTLIEAKTLGSAVSSVTFTSIPQTYTDLLLKTSARGSSTGGDPWQDAQLSFNSDTSNQTERWLGGFGSAAASGTGSSMMIRINKDSSTSNTFDNSECYICNYTSANYKSVSLDNIVENNATASLQMLTSFLWSNTAAITSLTLALSSGNFMVNSTFYLYGISNA